MNLLLDTHIWLWSETRPEQLAGAVAEAIRDSANELWLSPVSVWEFFLLAEKKRIVLDRDAHAELARLNPPGRYREAPLTTAIVKAAANLAMPQRDPADRFLAATALVRDFTLVTADQRLLALDAIAVLGNR